MKSLVSMLACLGFVVAVSGCSEEASTTTTTQTTLDHDDHDHDHEGAGGAIEAPVAPSADGEKFVLATEPGEFQHVIAARESAKDDDELVVFGQIGGSQNPWVEGRAMFTLVDDSLKSCDEIPGDGCPTPWDYCCETPKLKTATALIKVVDENGDPVKTDARELLGVRELTSVIVKGRAQRDDAGNLVVLATGVFVKK